MDDSWNLGSRSNSNARDLRVESAGSAKSNSSVNSVREIGSRDRATSAERTKDGPGKCGLETFTSICDGFTDHIFW